MLDEFDSETGIPKKYDEVYDWPIIKYEPSDSDSIFETALEFGDLIPGFATVPVKVLLPLLQRFFSIS
jgi:hypothetical protein